MNQSILKRMCNVDMDLIDALNNLSNPIRLLHSSVNIEEDVQFRHAPLSNLSNQCMPLGFCISYYHYYRFNLRKTLFLYLVH